MNAQTGFKKEIQNWQDKAKSGFPVIAPFEILCTYVEVFSVPFKFNTYRIFTYHKLNTSLIRYFVIRLRENYQKEFDEFMYSRRELTQQINVSKSFWSTVGNFFKYLGNKYHKGSFKEEVWEVDTALESVQAKEVLEGFPEYFEFADRSNKKLKYIGEVGDVKYRGFLTGKYYYDYYGYFWLEINPYFIPGIETEETAWVRETAINYEGKKDVQEWINANRPQFNESTVSSTTKRSLSFLLPLALALISKE